MMDGIAEAGRYWNPITPHRAEIKKEKAMADEVREA